MEAKHDVKEFAHKLSSCLDSEMKEVCRKMKRLDLRRFRTIAGQVIKKAEYNRMRG